MVVLLFNPLPRDGLAGLVGVVGSRALPLLCRSVRWAAFRSLDDREWANPLLSLRANAFVGDLSVLGIAPSSAVCLRSREVVGVRVRFRIVMPCRCLSLRFWLLGQLWLETGAETAYIGQ